jgi:ubiquinone/menaquinone biosynthesis C-methylase UbiE
MTEGTVGSSEIEAQRRYYAQTGRRYDEMHVHEGDEHFFALALLVAVLDQFSINSVLDVGSGTGRALTYIKQRRPDVRAVGVEPVAELRQAALLRGLSRDELIEGDARELQFKDGGFDLVSEFGMLHHVREPSVVVSEMLRVARRAVFISDSNNFGQGSRLVRTLKQALDHLGLWKVADFVKTRGRGYTISEGDGLSYSYSVFNDYEQIRAQCSAVHILNTEDAGINPYSSAGHVALLGIKR